jgi:predicted neutral ceramidase superfamily lipid hydrolase
VNADIPPKKNWAYVFSPSIILAIIFVMVGIYSQTPMERNEERAYAIYAVVFFLPCLIISLLIDLIIRFCVKNMKEKVLYIWVIEMLMIFFVFSLFIFWYSI